jgi:hypothetical protein
MCSLRFRQVGCGVIYVPTEIFLENSGIERNDSNQAMIIVFHARG